MSGGGASPSRNFAWIEVDDPEGGGSIVLVAADGTVKMPVVKYDDGTWAFLLSGPNGRVAQREPLEDYGSNAFCQRLAKLYGLVVASYEPTDVMDEALISVMGHTVSTLQENVLIVSQDIYSQVGFVDGVARVVTPDGSAACIVRNGVLYPIIAEYDTQIDDNYTLTDVWLNGDNMLASLQQMLARPARFLAYDNDERESRWSPVENYLHLHVKMPVVPKVGYVPPTEIGVGVLLPCIHYQVNLIHG